MHKIQSRFRSWGKWACTNKQLISQLRSGICVESWINLTCAGCATRLQNQIIAVSTLAVMTAVWFLY